MSHHPPFRKIYPAVASRQVMFALVNRHSQAPFDEDRISGRIRAGEWFEIEQASFDEMRNVRRPLFVHDGTFALSAFNAGNVAFVFVPMTIAGHPRWFLGSCDLAVSGSVEMLRDAIMARETGPDAHRLSRDEQLDIIWNATPPEFRTYTVIPNLPSPRYRDRRALLIDEDAQPCLLETLTAAQIEKMLPRDVTWIAGISGSGSQIEADPPHRASDPAIDHRRPDDRNASD